MHRIGNISWIALTAMACFTSCRRIKTDFKQPAVMQAAPFIMGSNELSIFRKDSCDAAIHIDTLQSVDNYRSFMRNYYQRDSHIGQYPCIYFLYNGEQEMPLGNLSVYPTFSRGGGLPSGSILHIVAYSYSDVDAKPTLIRPSLGQPGDSVYKYVKEFFIREADTGGIRGYSEKISKRVVISINKDSVQLINKLLSQFVKGYISAQRVLSEKKFNKKLDELPADKLYYLRDLNPPIFKITSPLK